MNTSEESRFDAPRFWQKLPVFARRAGLELVEKALWLFYAAQRPDTPRWARTVIYGALAYLLLPTDAIPDFLPGVGLTDDLASLVAALGLVAMYVNDDVKAQASSKLERWFGAGNLR
ncbi:YkvA family protein [Chitinilyticum piscinae]|uniref:DUF1232 domain-containing protein n=1 Tax=Chitinilyticum piscinae TaxID=2866724 RepID=A0A8J7FM84_9NEIS|nr:YkvA family protein [Chitinilyticum piscinae]MBE9610527.1 DUF1232 domain-containing protein [Chitinilyticum piscinae]